APPTRWRAPRRRKSRAASTAPLSISVFPGLPPLPTSNSRGFYTHFTALDMGRAAYPVKRTIAGNPARPYIPATFRSSLDDLLLRPDGRAKPGGDFCDGDSRTPDAESDRRLAVG